MAYIKQATIKFKKPALVEQGLAVVFEGSDEKDYVFIPRVHTDGLVYVTLPLADGTHEASHWLSKEASELIKGPGEKLLGPLVPEDRFFYGQRPRAVLPGYSYPALSMNEYASYGWLIGRTAELPVVPLLKLDESKTFQRYPH